MSLPDEYNALEDNSLQTFFRNRFSHIKKMNLVKLRDRLYFR